MKKYLIETYGCQMNIAESNAIELLLKGRGMERTEDVGETDAVIINTCSVRKSAENRIWGRLGYFTAQKKKHPFSLIVTGCMASRLLEELKIQSPGVDHVVPNSEKARIASIIMEDDSMDPSLSFFPSHYGEGEFSSFVPIMNGCNNFCSYCIVPYVRGRETSRDAEDIISEIVSMDASGVKEVCLLGQNVNSYRGLYKGREITFPELLELIVPHLVNIEWLRFESPHPKDFSDALISVIAREKKISKHIHLPMQSGSTRILGLMNRHTTREGFLALLERMRREIPGLTFSTDVIVGFPTETEEEYEETLSMMEAMGCTEAFMYYFNPREGTRAAVMEGQIDTDTKTRRLERLISEQLERQKRIKGAMVPFTATGIVTKISRDDSDRYLCRTEHNDYVSFVPLTPHREGDIVRVTAETLNGNTFRGKEIG